MCIERKRWLKSFFSFESNVGLEFGFVVDIFSNFLGELIGGLVLLSLDFRRRFGCQLGRLVSSLIRRRFLSMSAWDNINKSVCTLPPQSRTGEQERNSGKTLTFCLGYGWIDRPTDTTRSRVASPRLTSPTGQQCARAVSPNVLNLALTLLERQMDKQTE